MGVAENLQPDQAGPRGHPRMVIVQFGRGCAVRRVVGDVVGVQALGRDRTGVTEGLGRTGGRVRAVPGEVLVVDEDVRTVGPDEVLVVDVQPVGQECHLDPGAGVEVLRLRGRRVQECGIGQLQCLGFEERLGRVGGADGGIDRRSRLCCSAWMLLAVRPRGFRDRQVGVDRRHRRVRRNRALLGRGHRRGKGVHGVEAVDVLRAVRAGLVDRPALVRAVRVDPGGLLALADGQVVVLVVQHDDDVLRRPVIGGRRRRGSDRSYGDQTKTGQQGNDQCPPLRNRWHLARPLPKNAPCFACASGEHLLWKGTRQQQAALLESIFLSPTAMPVRIVTACPKNPNICSG